ncbi:MAG: hypothetical protein KF819_01880 [Labilithrix sp.]|nr:hypothetical protein [Labilithrix sp.]
MSKRALGLMVASTLAIACAAGEEAAESPSPAAPPATEAHAGEAPAGEVGACVAQPACREPSGPGVVREYARHRGRDQIFAEGEPQWVIGNFVIRTTEGDLKVADEVDVFVERACSGQWERLGRTRTSAGSSPPVEGVADDRGRVFFQVPKSAALAIGRHRVRMVVVADQAFADLWIDVVPRGAPIVVADVDGTLTESEATYAELRDTLPVARRDAAQALHTLVRKGHHVVYVSSRPEWLTDKTREFLDRFGFPKGVVHTTSTAAGASNADAQTFKTTELQRLAARGAIRWAFGNNVIDSEAFESVKIQPISQRVFVGATDKHGGRRIESFTELAPTLDAVGATCR